MVELWSAQVRAREARRTVARLRGLRSDRCGVHDSARGVSAALDLECQVGEAANFVQIAPLVRGLDPERGHGACFAAPVTRARRRVAQRAVEA